MGKGARSQINPAKLQNFQVYADALKQAGFITNFLIDEQKQIIAVNIHADYPKLIGIIKQDFGTPTKSSHLQTITPEFLKSKNTTLDELNKRVRSAFPINIGDVVEFHETNWRKAIQEPRAYFISYKNPDDEKTKIELNVIDIEYNGKLKDMFDWFLNWVQLLSTFDYKNLKPWQLDITRNMEDAERRAIGIKQKAEKLIKLEEEINSIRKSLESDYNLLKKYGFYDQFKSWGKI